MAFAGLYLRLALHFLAPLSVVALLLTLIAFCFPGWVLLSLLWGGEHATRRPELWLWGGWIGIAMCVWVASLEGYIAGTARGTAVLALDLAALIAWFTLSKKRGYSPTPIRPWRFGERMLWQLVSLWILAFVNHAYWSWGSATEAGLTRYPGAFGADLLALVSRAMMISSELPYSSPSFAGITAPLQSGATLMPVIGRYWMDPSGSMTAWMIVTGIFLAIGFGGILVSVLRAFVSRFRFLVLTVFLILFAYSFYWVFPAIRPDVVPSLSTYGLSPLSAHQGISPLLYRWILASPQTLLALGLALLAVAWIRAVPRPASWPVYGGIGLAAGLLAGIDYQIGWMGIVAGVIWLVAVWICYPHDRRNTSLGALLYVSATVIALLPVWILGVHSPHPLTRLQFEISAGDLVSAPARLVVLYGPLLVLGIWGGLFAERRFRGVASLTYGVMIALSVAMMLTVRVSGDPFFGERAGATLLFALLILGAARHSASDLASAGTGGWIILAAIGLAIPTVAFDYHSVGVREDIDAAILIHPADQAAAGWSLKVLPPNVVVQSHPEYTIAGPGDSLLTATISWGTDIALRPMAAGPLRLAAGLDDSVIGARTDQVLAMLTAKHPDSTSARADRLGIDYIYCGPNEMRRYPRLRARLSASPELFEAVYETDSAGIYRVYPRAIAE